MVRLLLLLLLFVGCSHKFPPETQDSVVQLIGKKDGIKRSTGTGFSVILSGKSVIITNAHVCGKYKIMYTKNGETQHKHEVVKISKKTDLCMLKGSKDIKPLTIAENVYLDEPVHAIGFPHGEFKIVTSGKIKGMTEIKSRWNLPIAECKNREYLKVFVPRNPFVNKECIATFKMYFTTIFSAPGGSGSPVVNSYGEVVSVVSAIETFGPAWAKTVPLSYLKDFLKER